MRAKRPSVPDALRVETEVYRHRSPSVKKPGTGSITQHTIDWAVVIYTYRNTAAIMGIMIGRPINPACEGMTVVEEELVSCYYTTVHKSVESGSKTINPGTVGSKIHTDIYQGEMINCRPRAWDRADTGHGSAVLQQEAYPTTKLYPTGFSPSYVVDV